jgi:hypothetical protein
VLQRFANGHIVVFRKVTLNLLMDKNNGLLMLPGKFSALLFKLLSKFFLGDLFMNGLNSQFKVIVVIGKALF